MLSEYTRQQEARAEALALDYHRVKVSPCPPMGSRAALLECFNERGIRVHVERVLTSGEIRPADRFVR